MSQNPLTDSATQSSKTPGLKPALAASLASLEVQLDQELARYRRTRTGTRILNQPRVGNYNSNPSQQLTVMTTSLENIQSTVATVKTDVPPTPVNDTLELEPESATTKTEEVESPNLPPAPKSSKNQNPSTSTASSIVPTVVHTNKPENHLQPDETPTQPEDYLESSEALLRSLTDEPRRTTKPSNSSDSLLSPLGIGSMLLLLMASLTLGYIFFNPKILSLINPSNLFKSNPSPPTKQPEVNTSSSLPQSQPVLTPIPKYPNLADKEFPKVRNPNDVVGLQPKVQPTPTALPNSVLLPQPINPTATIPAVSTLPQQPSNSPLNPKAKTAPKPTTTTPVKEDTEIKPSADGFYHLVMDNQGDRSLSAARQIVPDAYLSLDNKLIFLAALKTPEEAQQRLQQLQAKGLRARIKQP